MKFKLITCDIFTREVCALIARCPNTIDALFLPKGLHDIGCERMQARLQEVIGEVEEDVYNAILLGYGLCNNGIIGVQARSIPVVIPRVHDCISVFLGSAKRYEQYFNENPGTYFLTTGWVERGSPTGDLSNQAIGKQIGLDVSYEDLVEQYGEDNAAYLFEEMSRWKDNYSRVTFIEMGIEPDKRFEEEGRARAEKEGWKFEHVRGDLSMLQRLLAGTWNETEFLVVQPGHKVIAAYDGRIMATEKVEGPRQE